MRLHVTRVTERGKSVHIDIGIGFEREASSGILGYKSIEKTHSCDSYCKLLVGGHGRPSNRPQGRRNSRRSLSPPAAR